MFLKNINKSQFKQQSILYCPADRYLVQINQSYRAPLIIKVPTNDLCLSFCPQIIADATPGSREVPSDLHAASGAVLVPAHQSNKYLVWKKKIKNGRLLTVAVIVVAEC